MVAEMPIATTRRIVVNSPELFNRWNGASSGEFIMDSDQRAMDRARHLEQVELVDGRGWSPPHPNAIRPSARRGKLDNFVAHLENVTDLVLSPIAVSNAATLAKLKKLERLELIHGLFLPTSELGPIELIDLLTDSASLVDVKIAKELAPTWGLDKKRLVKSAARPGVTITWT